MFERQKVFEKKKIISNRTSKRHPHVHHLLHPFSDIVSRPECHLLFYAPSSIDMSTPPILVGDSRFGGFNLSPA